MTLKAIKTRIYPTITQQEKIIANFGYCRFVWNQLLDMQKQRYANGGSYVNEFGMNYLIKSL
ncbi:helix-turn-helix domain-containing protein, partial [Secundilactobacillus kimchicus]